MLDQSMLMVIINKLHMFFFFILKNKILSNFILVNVLVNSSEIVLVKNLNVEHFINIVKLDVRKTKKRFKNRIANCVYSRLQK